MTLCNVSFRVTGSQCMGKASTLYELYVRDHHMEWFSYQTFSEFRSLRYMVVSLLENADSNVILDAIRKMVIGQEFPTRKMMGSKTRKCIEDRELKLREFMNTLATQLMPVVEGHSEDSTCAQLRSVIHSFIQNRAAKVRANSETRRQSFPNRPSSNFDSPALVSRHTHPSPNYTTGTRRHTMAGQSSFVPTVCKRRAGSIVLSPQDLIEAQESSPISEISL